jgi:hypothetical protein
MVRLYGRGDEPGYGLVKYIFNKILEIEAGYGTYFTKKYKFQNLKVIKSVIILILL